MGTEAVRANERKGSLLTSYGSGRLGLEGSERTQGGESERSEKGRESIGGVGSCCVGAKKLLAPF